MVWGGVGLIYGGIQSTVLIIAWFGGARDCMTQYRTAFKIVVLMYFFLWLKPVAVGFL